jgi:hypothetical protein
VNDRSKTADTCVQGLSHFRNSKCVRDFSASPLVSPNAEFEAPNQMIAKHEKRRLVRAAAVIG